MGQIEDLDVYKLVEETTEYIYNITKSFPKQEDYGLTSQIRRGATSVLNNLVEGYYRGSLLEFIRFLYIANGSAAPNRFLS